MLKKVSKLTVLFCMLVFAGSAFAQNAFPLQPPHMVQQMQQRPS